MVGLGFALLIWVVVISNAVSFHAEWKKEKAKTIKATKYGSTVPQIIQTQGGSR